MFLFMYGVAGVTVAIILASVLRWRTELTWDEIAVYAFMAGFLWPITLCFAAVRIVEKGGGDV
jgi:hypothetical protein